jgi:hypothetical protein
MAKDKRYKTVFFLIQAGHIKLFGEIFETIPVSRVAIDFGSNYVRFKRKLRRPSNFRIGEIEILAKLFQVDLEIMLKLILLEIHKSRKRKIDEI